MGEFESWLLPLLISRTREMFVGRARANNALDVAKALSKVSNHSTQAMHAWHVAKMRFVTLLSTKVLNSLVKVVMVGEKSLSWSGSMQWSHLPHQYTAIYSGCCTSRQSLNTAWHA